ncbi:hypothetical protein BKM32_06580 [Mangrovimonas sp. DI 80]|nr:hypothetical protein BKM32_06580 [Mangrovimonas sp. DI 80]
MKKIYLALTLLVSPSVFSENVCEVNQHFDLDESVFFSEKDTETTYNWIFEKGNTLEGEDFTCANPGLATFASVISVKNVSAEQCYKIQEVPLNVTSTNLIVDKTTYTVEELVTDVLIDNPCVEVFNVSYSTGTNFNNPNGIGYFSGGQGFPFSEGILLMSGDVSLAEGPNNKQIASGGYDWLGDVDLDDVAGISSHNASIIEFDFIPIADTISFNFLMASEEYGSNHGYECDYSDAFAFLLTDSSGTTENLAVIPGTSTPVSVTNVRPASENCPAVNEEYFGGLTGVNEPPIAFDGRTKVFTAQSMVNSGEVYHIKLVIADGADTSLDSGVFLQAGSFNLGGDLGEDITIEARNTVCEGEIITLDTNVSSVIHTWYRNGEVIEGETSSNLNVTENAEYSVDIKFSTSCVVTDSIIVEFYPFPEVQGVQNLRDCAATSIADFDLTINTPLILGTQNTDDFNIEYYTKVEDAYNGEGLIENPEKYTAVDGQTIFVRIEDVYSETCFIVSEFSISIGKPVANQVLDIEICDDNANDGFELFNLEEQTGGILGEQSNELSVTYYASNSDADEGVRQLTSPYLNVSNPQIIYAKIEDESYQGCFDVTSFQLIVTSIPNDIEPIFYELCDDNLEEDGDPSNDKIQFDLSFLDSQILNGQSPVDFEVTYYETEEKAENGLESLPNLYENRANPQVIYARVKSRIAEANSICYEIGEITIQVNSLPNSGLKDRYVLCSQTDDSEYIEQPILDTGLSESEYLFVWYFNDQEILGATSPYYVPNEEGKFSVTVINIADSDETMCEYTYTAEVVESAPPVLNAKVITEAFAENSVVQAIAYGIGNYEYSLDDGSWQTTGVFYNVSWGEHTVIARDVLGCGEASVTINILDYPLFFTPNGDGYNDTWNIVGFSGQTTTKIYIFDGFGKLIKQISPSGDGWDGTYNGSPMPTNDYWFLVEYLESSTGQNKKFKAHFTLKR